MQQLTVVLAIHRPSYPYRPVSTHNQPTNTPPQVQLSNGLPARVSAMDADSGEITLDLNHELAGKHLTFDVTLQGLVPSEALQKATFGAGCFWG